MESTNFPYIYQAVNVFMRKHLLVFFLFALLKSLTGQTSVYLPGATNWVSCGDLDIPGTQLTVEAIITMTGPSVNIVSKHTGPANVNYLLRPGVFELTTTNGYVAAPNPAPLQLNQCYHIAATYDGTAVNYYVNGCLTGSTAWTGDMVLNDYITAIGQQSDCQCEQFTGYIDEVRIWNVARSQQQIAENMNNLPSPATQAGLMAYYKFEGTYANVQGNPIWDGVPQGAPQLTAAPSCTPDTLAFGSNYSAVSCAGAADGSITAFATGGAPPYSYSIDGVNFQSSNYFGGLTAGTYTVQVKSIGNCAKSSTLIIKEPSPIIVSPAVTNVTCAGGMDGSINTAVSGGLGPYSYLWNNSSTSSSLTGLAAGNYSVTVQDASCAVSPTELVLNGDFSQGNSSFSSSYAYCNTANCLNEATYTVTDYPPFHHASFTGVDHTTGNGNFMVVNGSSVSGATVWCQTVNVNPNSYYDFSAWLSSVYSDNPAQLQFSINGVNIGNTFSAPLNVNQWAQFNSQWNSGSATTANICIVNMNTSTSGNDFGIDDISFRQCTPSCSVTINIPVVEPLPLSSVAASQNITCNSACNGTANISASGGTGSLNYLWNTSQTGSSLTGLCPGTYVVTISDSVNCTTGDTITITEPPLLTASASSTDATCSGSDGSATVNATGGTGMYSYSWSTSPSQNTATASNIPTGTYSVTVTDSNNCSVVSTIGVGQISNLVASASVQTNAACFQSCDGSASAAPVGGTAPFIYFWNTSPVQTNSTATNLCAGTFTVIVTDSNNCIDSAQITISEPTPLTLSLSQNGPVCNGDTVMLSATINGGTSAYSYSWTGGPSTANYNPSVTATSYFHFTGADQNNCMISDSIQVIVHPPLSVSTLQSDSICSGSQTTIFASAGGGNGGPYTYTWSNNSTGSQTTVNPETTEFYYVVVTDNCTNQAAVDSVQVVVHPLPVVSFTTPSQGCAPLCPTIQDSSSIASGSITSLSWSSSDGQTGSGASFSPCYSDPGTYSLTLNAVSDKGCSSQFVESNFIEVYPDPVSSFNIFPEETSILEPYIETLNTSINGGSYYWDFGDSTSTTLSNPQHTYADTGLYEVMLITVSPDGCRDTSYSDVLIKPDFAFYIPNAFTPTRDTRNSIFNVYGIGINKFSLMIFNRWGNLVFSSSDPEVGWDGTYKGSPAQQDVYVYKVELTNALGKEYVRYGHVTLLR